jgi:hypothetical protein
MAGPSKYLELSERFAGLLGSVLIPFLLVCTPRNDKSRTAVQAKPVKVLMKRGRP